MKHLVLSLICLVALIQPVFSQNIGYLVVTDTAGKIEAKKALKLVEVYTIAELVFPNNCVNFEKELQKSPYFELRSREKSVYIEKKRINKHGKFRRLK